jgi:DMSO/TMAO reductase YedYZ heme-binding membrane subunit
VVAEHATLIYGVAIAGIVVIVAVLALTSIGHVIDAATQHFMLYYAGVFALITLCASVGLGLVSTDRMFLHPGQRVFIQAAHRAASFGAVAFLIIHIVTEILAQRVHVIDAVIPFLSPFRTFYIGLGTIASDLIILLVITGIMRSRFNASGKAWRWRAIHYTSYACLVFGVWHGLLGGRPGKPYVDWSYGFIVAFVAVGLAVRVLSNGLRPKENLSSPPVAQAANSASAPLRAAAMLAQYGGTRVGKTAILGGPATGTQPMLSAPVTATVLTALPAAGGANEGAQPFYEPGYEGPPRYLGAPRSTGSMPRAATGSMPRANTGSMPRIESGTQPRPATGPMPRTTGSMPRAATGSMPRIPTGPMPTSPMPRSGSGPMPTMGGSGPMPTMGSGPMPTMGRGQLPPSPTGPVPRSGSGPRPRPATGPIPRDRDASGPRPRPGTRPYPAGPAAPQSWTGPMPRSTGSMPRIDDDWDTQPNPTLVQRDPAGPRGQGGSPRRGGTGPSPAWDDPGPRRSPSGPMPREDRWSDYQDWSDAGQDQGWLEASHDGRRYAEQPPWDGYLPESDPGLRYREPGPGMPGYRGSREHRYGGDRY